MRVEISIVGNSNQVKLTLGIKTDVAIFNSGAKSGIANDMKCTCTMMFVLNMYLQRDISKDNISRSVFHKKKRVIASFAIGYFHVKLGVASIDDDIGTPDTKNSLNSVFSNSESATSVNIQM